MVNKMCELYLTEHSKELKESIMEYRQEYIDYGEQHINGSCGLIRYSNFDEWLERVAKSQNSETSHFKVPATTYFSVRKEDKKIVGSIVLRHCLTKELEEHGGHIGYGVRPSERKKGYGKQQLLLVLDIAKQMNIPKVMVSCNKANIPSAKTAVSCGGVLVRECVHEGVEQQIFWIDLC
jgi:predicted acetyltransferase